MSRIIDTNLNRFRESANKAIELFLTCFAPSKNILYFSDSKVFINNLEQLLGQEQYNFGFGFRFIIENIEKFRKDFCVNPVLYLIFLLCLLDRKVEWRELGNYDFSLFTNFLKDYRANSVFSKVKLSLEDIFNIINETTSLDSVFLKEVVEKAYSNNNIIIIEDKFNHIERDPNYSLKAFFYSKQPIIQRTKFIPWEGKFTQKDLDYFISLTYQTQEKICFTLGDVDTEVKEKIKSVAHSNDLLSFIHIPSSYYLRYVEDLKILSGAQILFNPIYTKLDEYVFGYLDGVTKQAEQVKVLGSIKLKEGDIRLSYLKGRSERLSNVLGNNYNIRVVSDLLEKVRTLVSFARGIYKEGVFFNEPQTLNLMKIYLDNPLYTDLIDKVIRKYLNLFEVPPLQMEEVLKQKDFKQSFNPVTKKFQKNSIFSSFTYYINTFKLLESNVKVLKTLV